MKERIEMLDLSRLHSFLSKELKEAFEKTLISGRFIGGEAVAQFEADLSSYTGGLEAVALSSGTDALFATLMALGLKPGDEVITTPFTFVATAGAIARTGATPVFVDIDPKTFNIDPGRIEEKIGEKTAGILPVHLFGACCQMSTIMEIARKRGVWVLEDCAQSIGATHAGKMAGTMGIGGAFSFFPAKNLGALGDGGAAVTGDREIAGKIRAIRSHGEQDRYEYEMLGGNFRLDALQAAFLSIKLRHLNEWEQGRRRVARIYGEAFENYAEIQNPKPVQGDGHVFNQYVIRTKEREKIRGALKKNNIACAVYYPKPLHLQRCFDYLGYFEGSFEEAERASKEVLALPIDPYLEKEDQFRIIEVVTSVLTKSQ